MRSAVMLCLLVVLSATPMLAAEYWVGGGFVINESDLEVPPVSDPDFEILGRDDIDGDGLFGIFHAVAPNGFLFQASLSFTSADGTVTADVDGDPAVRTETEFDVEDDITRLDLSIGQIYRTEQKIRPFFHLGLSLLLVEEEVSDGTTTVESVDDNSAALTAGGGLEIVLGNHAIYTDVTFDFGHDVDIEVDGDLLGEWDFDMGELHFGYIYRF